MKILGIDHISIATGDISGHREIFKRLFGIESGPAESNSANRVAISFLDFGNIDVELIEPLQRETAISKFLEKRGPGIHHLCVLVEDIDQALEELHAKKVKLADQKPRAGAGGARIAFIHPDSTGGVLIELKEQKPESH
ncbi:MAG: methylmalonyl-CoA epimerase [candidate division Zixibacteria bacterium RBG_16_53_22]|nr:MAG: methylmalonyl-CoA epimerase [candidate division Zixibacteria bacterium RBG_16_53_22]